MANFGARDPAVAQLKEGSLASTPKRRVTDATRIPMSAPNSKLSVPELPGWHLHWMLGANVPKAFRAGYELVADDEVDVEQKGIANSADESGNTDMGSHISIAAGGTVSDDDLRPERLYLMKLPEEWWLKDQQALEDRNDAIAETMRRGLVGADGDMDKAMRYLKAGQDLFFKKPK